MMLLYAMRCRRKWMLRTETGWLFFIRNWNWHKNTIILRSMQWVMRFFNYTNIHYTRAADYSHTHTNAVTAVYGTLCDCRRRRFDGLTTRRRVVDEIPQPIMRNIICTPRSVQWKLAQSMFTHISRVRSVRSVNSLMAPAALVAYSCEQMDTCCALTCTSSWEYEIENLPLRLAQWSQRFWCCMSYKI